MSRCRALTDQPFSTNVAASQSSSSGCVGFLPVAPKLLGLPARGVPKCHAQTRLTITRAVSGLDGDATHSANSFRRPSTAVVTSPPLPPLAADSTPGLTGSLGLNGSPPG